MPRLVFDSAFDDAGVLITLRKRGLFGGSIVRPGEWSEVAGDPAFAGLARILPLIERMKQEPGSMLGSLNEGCSVTPVIHFV